MRNSNDNYTCEPAQEESHADLHPNYKIMVVDDEAIYLVELEELLQEHGYRVVGAIDGTACLELVEKYRPDLLLLDIAMPKLDGFGVLRQLKSNPTFKRLPVMLVSGKASAEDIPPDCRPYVADYFSKPFNLNTLLAHIEKLLLFGSN